MRIKHTVRVTKEALAFDNDGSVERSYANTVGRHFGQQVVDRIAPQITPYRDGAPFVQGYEFSLDLEVMASSELERLLDDSRKTAHRVGFEEGRRAGIEEARKLITLNLFRTDIKVS